MNNAVIYYKKVNNNTKWSYVVGRGAVERFHDGGDKIPAVEVCGRIEVDPTVAVAADAPVAGLILGAKPPG